MEMKRERERNTQRKMREKIEKEKNAFIFSLLPIDKCDTNSCLMWSQTNISVEASETRPVPRFLHRHTRVTSDL